MRSLENFSSLTSQQHLHTTVPTHQIELMPDKQLWDQFKTGNKEAFDIIYDRHFQPLCWYGDKICRNKELVEDVIQDLFIYLWNRRSQLGHTDCIKFYLFLSLRRKLVRTMDQEGKRKLSNQVNFQLELSLQNTSSIASEQEEERKKLLARALTKLTDRQREVIYLKFYNNLSFQEVASVMDIDVRSVYNLVGRTIDILRADFKNNPSASQVSSVSFIVAMLVTYMDNVI